MECLWGLRAVTAWLLGAVALGLCGASPAAGITAGAAKWLGPGPFQAAPILQGGWASGDPSDTLTFSRGAQISGLFYETLDADQGSIVLWITPEWDGTDGKRHDLFNNSLGEFMGT